MVKIFIIMKVVYYRPCARAGTLLHHQIMHPPFLRGKNVRILCLQFFLMLIQMNRTKTKRQSSTGIN